MIPNALTLPAIQDFARDVNAKLDGLLVRNVDMNGRRVINAGRAISDFDCVTLFDLNRAIDGVTTARTDTSGPVGLLNAAGVIRFGAFASRGSSVAHANELFVATDLDYITWLSTGAGWIYITGTRAVVQADITTFAANLTTNDARLLMEVTDYSHVLKWSGSAWNWGPGESGGHPIEGHPVDPGVGWGLCDGSTYAYLQADGTTADFTTPDYTTAAYLKLGISNTIGPTAASGVVSSETAHTHSVSGTTGVPSATTTVDNNGGGSTVAVGSNTHTHTFSASTSGGTAHDHGPNTLELRRTLLKAFFRR